jgi:hypothetical protein
MRNAESLTNSQIDGFLKASAAIEFSGQNRKEVYTWVEKMLVDQEYQQQRRKQRGAIRAYLSKVAGLSLAQITRLIRAHAQTRRRRSIGGSDSPRNTRPPTLRCWRKWTARTSG